MKTTIKNVIKYRFSLGLITLVSFSCQANIYVGYDAGRVSYHETTSVANNKIKLGFLDESITPLRFGAEGDFQLSPDARLYGGKFRRFRFSLLGVADYQLSEKWHSILKAGLGFEQIKYIKRHYTQEEGKIFPMVAVGIFWHATRAFDIGLTMHREESSFRNTSTYGMFGFNCYINK